MILSVLQQLPANRADVIPRVDRAIRLALLRHGGVPNLFTSHAVHNGMLHLTVKGEFEVSEGLWASLLLLPSFAMTLDCGGIGYIEQILLYIVL